MKRDPLPMDIAKPLLRPAFAELRRRGYLARQNFLCCQNCAGAELTGVAKERIAAGKEVRGSVFYTAQDEEMAVNDLYIAYGPLYADDEEQIGIDTRLAGQEIVEILRRQGLPVEWNGDPDVRIKVDLKALNEGWRP